MVPPRSVIAEQADLETNSTYHSFPKPKFSMNTERPGLASSAEESLRQVLHSHRPEYPEGDFGDRNMASIKPSDMERMVYSDAQSCGIVNQGTVDDQDLSSKQSSPLAPLLPNDLDYASPISQSAFEASLGTLCGPDSSPRAPTPRPHCSRPHCSRPANNSSHHHPPRRVYTSSLNTLASIRLNIIEQEELFGSYENEYRQRRQRIIGKIAGTMMVLGMMAGISGMVLMLAGGMDLKVELWRSLAWARFGWGI
ncbi:hypothetical protein BDZ91DRAFT_765135 [Kalaharituber pfeilii]|nr:hypothetical protein BDZ91DRAFT_765135 [Kalaharituber pfeilii]